MVYYHLKIYCDNLKMYTIYTINHKVRTKITNQRVMHTNKNKIEGRNREKSKHKKDEKIE